ncbi:MAG: hypothetical protein LBD37_02090 [Treponema sp.]|jgi:hypothetical protein|nr:hypothetical protein [Treponema sp.]
MIWKTLPYLLAALCLPPLAPPAAAQSAAPAWYFDRTASYPSQWYISAVGEGKTRAAAEAAAVAGVSLFFNTSAEVRNEAIRNFNETVVNKTSSLSKSTSISENAVIKSEADFLGVRFANPWQDQSRGIWAALAFIDRREAAQMYGSKIAANMAVINALAADAGQEAEALYVCGLLFRAASAGALTEEYIKTAVVVDPASGAKYAAHIAAIQDIRANYRAKRDGLRFTVTAQSPENSGRLERKLNALLENHGYVTASGGGSYTLSARLAGEELINDVGNFVTPGVTIRLEREGRALFSYTKTYGRSSHRTSMAAAYTRALLEIERDLEENFMRELSALLGG